MSILKYCLCQLSQQYAPIIGYIAKNQPFQSFMPLRHTFLRTVRLREELIEGRLTFDNVIHARLHILPSTIHQCTREQARVNALGLPHVDPVSYPQPENAWPARSETTN